MPKLLSMFLKFAGILAACGVAWISFAQAFANIVAGQSTDTALSLVEGHSEALAKKANLLFAADIQNPPANKIRPLARRSLAGDLINAEAIRLLAASDLADGDTNRFRKLIELSAKLSRRDFMTQIYLIQEFAKDRNISKSLAHFDIALRTNRSGADLVYAILTPLLVDAEVRSALRPYIKGNAIWIQPFFAYATNNGEDPESIAKTLIASGGLKYDQDYPYTQGNIVNRLILENKFQEAKEFYLEGAKGNPAALKTIDFSPANTEPRFAPISWRLSSSPGIGASFEGVENLQMRIEVGPESVETAASKNVYLTSGSYRISAGIKWGPFDSEGEVKMSLVCLTGSSGIVFMDVANASSSKDVVSGNFEIDTDCTAQTLIVQVESFPGQGGIDVLMGSPKLSKN